MHAAIRFAIVGLLVSVALAGCRKKEDLQVLPGPVEKDYEKQLRPGEPALRKITDLKEIPDFTQACSDLAGAREAVNRSLSYLRKPSSQKAYPVGGITHAQAAASMEAFGRLLDSRPAPAALNAAIRGQFDVYMSVGCDGDGTVLFTGYYTPILAGSPVRTDRFRCPLFGPPPGLQKNEDGTPTQPMPDRRSIESSNMFAGNELVWLADPFEAYVAHIQGSARIRMPDNREITVGYTANNGHEYNSIRAELVKDGKIARRAGLRAMIAYFKEHPGEVTKYTWRNPRFVFFAPITDGQPRGCINEPVTPWRTIATDKKIFPPGGLAFISTRLPVAHGGDVVDVPFRGFALDQDAGGAIRAPGRCDVYMGVGDAAGELAGRTQNEGRLYYLILKSAATAPDLRPIPSAK